MSWFHHDVIKCLLLKFKIYLWWSLCIFSDMSFDQLGSGLLQQPLLSSQIIPELADDDIYINKAVKPSAIMQKPIKKTQLNTNKVIQQNAVSANTVQAKNHRIEHSVNAQKFQYVKNIQTNVVQVSDPKITVKPQNNAVINENVIMNTPIVINKVTGNISGMYWIIGLNVTTKRHRNVSIKNHW